MGSKPVDDVERAVVNEYKPAQDLSDFEDYEAQYEWYLQELVYYYTEHSSWYEFGFVCSKNFLPKTLFNVYHNNLYCMSWFYNGVFPFDCWEEDYDN